MKNRRTPVLFSAFILVAFSIVACNKNSTPTNAMQTYWYAMKNKDVMAWKSIFTKERRERYEKKAKAQNKPLDDLYKEDLDYDYPLISRMPDKLETRNETISSDGNSATLEVKNPKNESWVTASFVKEDDGWKLVDSGLTL